MISDKKPFAVRRNVGGEGFSQDINLGNMRVLPGIYHRDVVTETITHVKRAVIGAQYRRTCTVANRDLFNNLIGSGFNNTEASSRPCAGNIELRTIGA